MKTTTTHPDGSQTVTKTDKPLGCCGWAIWLVLGAFVLVAPWEYLPLWGAIPIYVVEFVIALGLVVAWGQGKFKRAGPAPTGPPPSPPTSA